MDRTQLPVTKVRNGDFTFYLRLKPGDWIPMSTVGSTHAKPIPVTINMQTPWGMTSVMATLYGPPDDTRRPISDYSTEELLLEVSNRVKAMIDDPPDSEEDYCD